MEELWFVARLVMGQGEYEENGEKQKAEQLKKKMGDMEFGFGQENDHETEEAWDRKLGYEDGFLLY